MSSKEEVTITCNNCGHVHNVSFKQNFTGDELGDYGESIYSEMSVVCPKCLTEEEYKHSISYIFDDNFIVTYETSSSAMGYLVDRLKRMSRNSEEFRNKYSNIRVVCDMYIFIEKIKIHKQCLDDRVIEIIKLKLIEKYNLKNVDEIIFEGRTDDELSFNIAYYYNINNEEIKTVNMDYYYQIEKTYFSNKSNGDYQSNNNYVVDSNYAKRILYDLDIVTDSCEYLMSNKYPVVYVSIDDSFNYIPYKCEADLFYGDYVSVLYNNEIKKAKVICQVFMLGKDIAKNNMDEIKSIYINDLSDNTVETYKRIVASKITVKVKDVYFVGNEFQLFQKGLIFKYEKMIYTKENYYEDDSNCRIYILSRNHRNHTDEHGNKYSSLYGSYFKVINVIPGTRTKIILLELPYADFFYYQDNLIKEYNLIDYAAKAQIEDEIDFFEKNKLHKKYSFNYQLNETINDKQELVDSLRHPLYVPNVIIE